MLYYLLKPVVRIFMHIFYRIQVKGLDNLPSGKPVVLIPNHVNGFVDPLLVGMFSKPKVRFFARGDVFKGRIVKWLLNDMNVSPMYRISEGYGEVKKNDKTFEECRSLLGQRKALLMFPEGICIQDRRVKKFKKGLARIILSVEALDSNKSDILVIPVGLNYSSAKDFRSKVFIQFGEPIHLSDFQKRYQEDKVRAINVCSQFMETELAKLVVTISKPENDELYEALSEIYIRQRIEEQGGKSSNLETVYKKNRELASLINSLEETSPGQIQELKEKVIPYLCELKRIKLRDHLLRRDRLAKMNLQSILNDFLIMWFGLPLYWIGLLLNLPPYRLARNTARDKAKQVEFYASIYANLAMFCWLGYYVLQLILIRRITHQWATVAVWALLVPLTGWFAITFYPVRKKVFGRWKLLGLVKKDKATAERLIHEREEIIGRIKGLGL